MLLWWVLACGVYVFISIGNDDSLKCCDDGNGCVSGALSDVDVCDVGAAAIGDLSYVHRDISQDGSLSFSVSFSLLEVANGQLGVFRSALHKVVGVRDLRVCFFGYGSDCGKGLGGEGDVGGRVAFGGDNSIEGDVFAGTRSLAAKVLLGVANNAGIQSMPMMSRAVVKNDSRVDFVDFSNTSEVRVIGFDCEFLVDGEGVLGISSKRASISYRLPESISLRGHATIRTSDGIVLESNSVKWRVSDGVFSIDGRYVLTRDGVKTTGNGICLDERLRPIRGQYARMDIDVNSSNSNSNSNSSSNTNSRACVYANTNTNGAIKY